jgi:hypothetical protein
VVIVTSTIVPVATFKSLRRQVPLHLVKQRLAQIMRFERSSDRTIATN